MHLLCSASPQVCIDTQGYPTACKLSSQWMLTVGTRPPSNRLFPIQELRAAHAQRSSTISKGYMQASTSYTQGTGNAFGVSSSRRQSGRVVGFATNPTSQHTPFERAPNGVCCCVICSTLATAGKHEARTLPVAKAQACSTHVCCAVSQHKSAKNPTPTPTNNSVYLSANKQATVLLQTRELPATVQDCSQRSQHHFDATLEDGRSHPDARTLPLPHCRTTPHCHTAEQHQPRWCSVKLDTHTARPPMHRTTTSSNRRVGPAHTCAHLHPYTAHTVSRERQRLHTSKATRTRVSFPLPACWRSLHCKQACMHGAKPGRQKEACQQAVYS